MRNRQQQAGVVEAREAVKQANETLKQGRSIILFTVVTIIFVCPSTLITFILTEISSYPYRFAQAYSA